jgi:DNA-nicking Smr family endonuclease
MASIKQFSDLKSLRKRLKDEEEARRQEEMERARQAQQARRDADLFRQSIGEVVPLAPPNKHIVSPPPPLPVARHRMADELAALQESLSDEFNVDSLLDTDEALSFARNGIGHDVVRKLRRGHWVIQDQLDLHGLRRDQARESLAEFLRRACKRGMRCVRIIHGKGLGSVNKEPILKNKVRSWLVQKEEVLAFCQARAADGGSGALVVLLKAQG